MKKLIVFATGFLIIVAGCKKDSSLKIDNQQLIGKWELTKSFGGWSGEKKYEPGNGNTISFAGSNSVQHFAYNDTSFTTTATYTIYQGKPCEFAAETTLIHFKIADNYEYDNDFSLANGELAIGSTQCIADGSTNYYRKVQ